MKCGNDNAYYYRLENFPAGAFFGMYDDPDCRSSTGNFFFYLRGTKHPFQMEWQEISQLEHVAIGGMAKPGLKMIDKKDKPGQIHGKLSCFYYWYQLPESR
ncbi:hypothetical protein D3C81_1204130 [compost metagenome]